MKCHQTEQSTRDALRRDIHIPKGVYCLLVSDRMKVSSFQVTKTSANKRFYNMSANRLLGFALQRYEKKCICARKVYFYCHRLHFFTVASRIKVPSKVQQKMQMRKYGE